jgi:hypothetical protein
MTTPEGRGEENGSREADEGTPEVPSTPLLPALQRNGPRWIAFLGFHAAVAALVWRCG